jgi:glycosyltransferase involved in cell wall biosynthesis
MASVGKVLIIVQNLPLPFDRRVWLEAKTLKEAGYEVAIISPKGKHGKFQENYIELEAIHLYRYPAPPEANGLLGYVIEFVYCWFMTAVLSLKVLQQHGFNIIHACNPPETFFLLAWFYKLFGKKFIFDHHDLSPEMYVAKGGKKGGLLYRGLVFLERLTFKTANVVITTNQSHKVVAQRRGGVGAENIFIVRTGPDFERLQVLKPEPALKDGFSYLACYLGEMCEQDGVEYILDVAHTLHNKLNRHDIKFVMMGGGPALDKLKQKNISMGLESFVEFLGRVTDHDLCRYLSTADICLDPDPYTEWADQSTMNKIMEYMTFAKPTVAFDLTENRYSAQEAAVYVKPNDTQEFATMINQLLNDEETRLQMGTFGQERVRRELAWDYSKPALLAAYAKVTSS